MRNILPREGRHFLYNFRVFLISADLFQCRLCRLTYSTYKNLQIDAHWMASQVSWEAPLCKPASDDHEFISHDDQGTSVPLKIVFDFRIERNHSSRVSQKISDQVSPVSQFINTYPVFLSNFLETVTCHRRHNL